MSALRVPDSCAVCGGLSVSLRIRDGKPVCKAHAKHIDRVPLHDLRAMASGVCPDCAMKRIHYGINLYDSRHKCSKHERRDFSLSDFP